MKSYQEKEQHLKFLYMVKGLFNLSKFGLVLLIFFIEGCLGSKSNNAFYKDVLGLNIAFKKQEYFYKEAGAPNEGFSFEIQSFSAKKGNFFSGEGYPLNYESKQDWDVFKWKQTPFSNENKALDLLFKYDVKDSLLKSHISTVKKLIADNRNYISFLYKKEDSFIYSIECYLLDLTNSKIFIIKVST